MPDAQPQQPTQPTQQPAQPDMFVELERERLRAQIAFYESKITNTHGKQLPRPV